jgi:hypothetical protein
MLKMRGKSCMRCQSMHIKCNLFEGNPSPAELSMHQQGTQLEESTADMARTMRLICGAFSLEGPLLAVVQAELKQRLLKNS